MKGGDDEICYAQLGSLILIQSAAYIQV